MLTMAGSGCGSSDSDDSADTPGNVTPTQTSPSKPEFITAADKVCRQLGRDTDGLVERMQQVQESYSAAPDEAALDKRVRELASLLGRFEKRFRAGNEELAGLSAPDDPTLAKYLEAREAYADDVARLAAAQSDYADASAEDQAEANKAIVSASKAGDRTTARLQQLARAYGFKTCHRGA
jgi:hypothetical protein